MEKETLEKNTYNITVDLADKELLGKTGEVTFSLTECKAELGIVFNSYAVPIIGRVVGDEAVYLCGVKDYRNNIAFYIFDMKNHKIFQACWNYDVLTIADVNTDEAEDEQTSLIKRAKLEHTTDTHSNERWLNGLFDMLDKGECPTTEELVFLSRIVDNEGADLFNSIIDHALEGEKESMSFAIMHFVMTRSYDEVKDALKTMKLIPRISLLKKIKKFYKAMDDFDAETEYNKFNDFLFDAPFATIERIFKAVSAYNDERKVFDAFETNIIEESFNAYFAGHIFSLS